MSILELQIVLDAVVNNQLLAALQPLVNTCNHSRRVDNPVILSQQNQYWHCQTRKALRLKIAGIHEDLHLVKIRCYLVHSELVLCHKRKLFLIVCE